MATHLIAKGWLLTLLVSALLLLPFFLLAQAPPPSSSQVRLSTLPGNPFPRANCVLVRPTNAGPVAMAQLVRYLRTQGYVVDSVDQVIFFTVWAHTTLPLPRRPLRLQVRASFDQPDSSVWLRGTYVPLLPLRVRAIPVPPTLAHPFAPSRPRTVRYSTWLAPPRRAAFVELQRLGHKAFPGALLTYANEAF